MDKLLLLSVVFATIALPASFARAKNARRALRRTVFTFVVFDIAYFIAVFYFYPQIV